MYYQEVMRRMASGIEDVEENEGVGSVKCEGNSDPDVIILMVLVDLPGCGKSYFGKQMELRGKRKWKVLSQDDRHERTKGDEGSPWKTQ